jgi:hypothetical protein
VRAGARLANRTAGYCATARIGQAMVRHVLILSESAGGTRRSIRQRTILRPHKSASRSRSRLPSWSITCREERQDRQQDHRQEDQRSDFSDRHPWFSKVLY